MLSLIDSTPSSLTVTWPITKGAVRYVLQYRKSGSEAFETLSDKLTTTQARKRNLTDTSHAGFIFRAGAITNKDQNDVSDWVTHSEPFHLLSERQETKRMAPPRATLAGSNQALLVKWSAVPSATQYELQMRENDGGEPWRTISSTLSGTEVKKKNLASKFGYQFRVRPSGDAEMPFSSPSDAIVALGLSDGVKRLFNGLDDGILLQNPGAKPVPLDDALGGKEFILLYASAHWCGPCRQLTPQLVNWYRSLGANRTAEVVFLSCDHDENGFQNYYKGMPWLAVPFDDDAREQLLGHIRVQGIPRLVVLDGKTGRIIVDNAVGQPMDLNNWRRLAATKK